MIKVEVLAHAEPTPAQLEKLRQYASVPNDQRDALLMSCLRRAMLDIQEASGVAMLGSELRMTVTGAKAGEAFTLYQGGRDVVSVKDEFGAPVPYLPEGGRVRVQRACRHLEITYRNEVLPSELSRLELAAYQYATALYDGEEASVLDDILRRTHGC